MVDLILWLVFFPDARALDSHSYQVRQEAEARLLRWPWLASRVVRPMASSRSPEARRRARRVLDAVLPASMPPLALFDPGPMIEWVSPEDRNRITDKRPSPDWRLSWYKPSNRSYALSPVVYVYHRRTRNQTRWKEWDLDEESRQATRLLADDLLALGIPPVVIEHFLIDPLTRAEIAVLSRK